MLNESQKSKVQRFANDEALSDAIKQLIRESFLKPKPNRDVYQLAAVTIAIGLLDDAWREIERYKQNVESDSVQNKTQHV